VVKSDEADYVCEARNTKGSDRVVMRIDVECRFSWYSLSVVDLLDIAYDYFLACLPLIFYKYYSVRAPG